MYTQNELQSGRSFSDGEQGN